MFLPQGLLRNVSLRLHKGPRREETSRLSFALALCLGVLVFSHADADHHHKDTDALTECTIESSGGGGGCVSGFKRVCQKLKNGKKCCGCVEEKHSEATTTPPPAATTHTYHCLSNFIPGVGTIDCTVVKGSEDEAYGYCLQDAQAKFPNAQVPAGALKCSLVK
jgi:hypothetical protein